MKEEEAEVDVRVQAETVRRWRRRQSWERSKRRKSKKRRKWREWKRKRERGGGR